ncbi:TetR family transcriptional regulator [Streptomyces sp. NPDC058674]|uniref:TetR family transcriptional regulator n=1 Tax=Streptomyces sp. NPDC058674 TaxID=3346592 RepID=UPI00364AB4C5
MVKQERAARTRESLVRAAAEVFAEQGFTTASIAAISRRAGVSAGGLHFHFESKTALADAVEDRAVQALRRITAGRPGSAYAAQGAQGAHRAEGADAASASDAVAASDVPAPVVPVDAPRETGAADGAGARGAVDGAGAAGATGVPGGLGVPDGADGSAGVGGLVEVNALQVLVDSSHALMALLAGDVVVRAGYGLCADASRRSGVDLHRQWSLWVEEVMGAAAREGVLVEGVLPQDAARVVVASTVGLEVLGARERDWIAPHTLTRLWMLILPRLAAAGVLGALMPQGSAAGPGPPDAFPDAPAR